MKKQDAIQLGYTVSLKTTNTMGENVFHISRGQTHHVCIEGPDGTLQIPTIIGKKPSRKDLVLR